MKKITIGKEDRSGTAKGRHPNVTIDLRVLKQTRLLITADSGGGKTYLMKKIVEESSGKLPIHIIDPEGEFAPLRELLDFFLIAKGGDTPPVIGLARAQAQKFLELRASVICDIYEMRPAQRHEWVKEYLEGLIEAPKSSRHPCLVIVDEAHLFAPETGKSLALDAMADLASRGRKRGLILIVATQRLAKLNKDVTSEMLNRLIGPTFEDVNRKRAAEVLGVLKSDEREFFDQIKMLEPGHFFALGRAISKTLIRVKIGAIRTKHGDEAEKYNTTPPPPRSKIATLLKTLKELPAEEERKAETARELRAEIRRLRDELRDVKHSNQFDKKGNFPDRKATKSAIKAEVSKRFKKLKGLLEDFVRVIVKIEAKGFDHAMVTPGEIKLALDGVARQIADLNKKQLAKRDAEFEELKTQTKTLLDRMKKVLEEENLTVTMEVEPAKTFVPPKVAILPVESRQPPKQKESKAATNGDAEGDINRSQVKILKALQELAQIGVTSPGKSQVAFWSGAPVTSSTFANNISNLRTRGMLLYPGPGLVAIDPSIQDDPRFRPHGLTKADVESRSRELLSATQIAMMSAIRAAFPGDMSKEQLASETGGSITSSTFANNISELKTAGLLTYPRPGFVKMADWLDL